MGSFKRMRWLKDGGVFIKVVNQLCSVCITCMSLGVTCEAHAQSVAMEHGDSFSYKSFPVTPLAIVAPPCVIVLSV